jgi:uncharacterized protein YegJ (DUF2314 family)
MRAARQGGSRASVARVMADRNRIYVVLALGAAVLALVFAFGKSPKTTSRSDADDAVDTRATGSSTELPPIPSAALLPHSPVRIKRPAVAVAEFGVFTDRPSAELELLTQPKNALALLTPAHCGDAATCDAVRAFLGEPDALRIEATPAQNWRLPNKSELPRVASTLSSGERDKLIAMPRSLHVTVRGAALPNQLPARAGFALTAALASKVSGFVYDQVVDRVERPAEFAKHVITVPLGARAFRKDRVDFQYSSRQGGTVRLISAGMVRFGAPDLEVFSAPRGVANRLVDVMIALADALTSGATTSPIAITLDDIERARAELFGPDAGMPPSVAIDVDLEDAAPESGDPNEIMARIVPPDGPTPEGYDDLVEMFFGQSSAWQPPSEDEFKAIKDKTQKALATALMRHKKEKLELYVQLGFPTAVALKQPGGPDASDLDAFEWMWVEVTAFDDKDVTGTLIDEPENVPGAAKGQSVTRKRSEVSDYLLKLADGGTESASMAAE